MYHGDHLPDLFTGHFTLIGTFIGNFLENNKVPINGKFACGTRTSTGTGLDFNTDNESSDSRIIKWTVTTRLAVALHILCFVLFLFVIWQPVESRAP